jgi:hypothetical protein
VQLKIPEHVDIKKILRTFAEYESWLTASNQETIITLVKKKNLDVDEKYCTNLALTVIENKDQVLNYLKLEKAFFKEVIESDYPISTLEVLAKINTLKQNLQNYHNPLKSDIIKDVFRTPNLSLLKQYIELIKNVRFTEENFIDVDVKSLKNLLICEEHEDIDDILIRIIKSRDDVESLLSNYVSNLKIKYKVPSESLISERIMEIFLTERMSVYEVLNHHIGDEGINYQNWLPYLESLGMFNMFWKEVKKIKMSSICKVELFRHRLLNSCENQMFTIEKRGNYLSNLFNILITSIIIIITNLSLRKFE